MRIGIHGGSNVVLGATVEAIGDHVAAAEADGFSSYWLPQFPAPDILTLYAAIAPRTAHIELGTAVVPTWPRHPLMLAGQALTVAQLVGGDRLVLGLGVAHKPTVEARYRVPFERPARHMAEYLDVLLAAMVEGHSDVEGEIWSGVEEHMARPEGVVPPTVMLAAMGPRMLALAGQRTAGTILWLSGPRVVGEVIGPAIVEAAASAGRPAPRIVASVPLCVTDRPEAVRTFIGEMLVGYDEVPSYRRVMDAEGVAGVADVSLVGTAEQVREGLGAFEEAGATDFAAVEFGTTPDEMAATRQLLVEVQAGR